MQNIFFCWCWLSYIQPSAANSALPKSRKNLQWGNIEYSYLKNETLLCIFARFYRNYFSHARLFLLFKLKKLHTRPKKLGHDWFFCLCLSLCRFYIVFSQPLFIDPHVGVVLCYIAKSSLMVNNYWPKYDHDQLLSDTKIT